MANTEVTLEHLISSILPDDHEVEPPGMASRLKLGQEMSRPSSAPPTMHMNFPVPNGFNNDDYLATPEYFEYYHNLKNPRLPIPHITSEQYQYHVSGNRNMYFQKMPQHHPQENMGYRSPVDWGMDSDQGLDYSPSMQSSSFESVTNKMANLSLEPDDDYFPYSPQSPSMYSGYYSPVYPQPNNYNTQQPVRQQQPPRRERRARSPYRQKPSGSPRNMPMMPEYFHVGSAGQGYESSYNAPAKYSRDSTPKVRSATLQKKSSLLEEFSSAKNTNKFALHEIEGHFVEFSKDQYGSRFIQQKLEEEATPNDKDLVFCEIYPEAYTLMTDVFGNYVIQKFFEYGTTEQKRKLGEALKGHVLTLSLQMYGCRVVQKALEVISEHQQAELVRELEGYVMKCIKDQNGNHVIQKVIEKVPSKYTQFIVQTFVTKVYDLAVHPYGCRVIQRILEHHGGRRNRVQSEAALVIVAELLQCTLDLVCDQYGNYVIQHVLKHGKPNDKHNIIKQLRGRMVEFSQHKFASNVIEQCVEHGSDEHRQWVIDEILVDNGRALEDMMQHQYANYVIQKILEVCNHTQRTHFIQFLQPHLPALKKFTYGKHILASLEKYNKY